MRRDVSGDVNTRLFNEQSSDMSWMFNEQSRNISYDVFIKKEMLNEVKEQGVIIDSDDFDKECAKIIVDEVDFDKVEKIVGDDYEITAYNYCFHSLESFNLEILKNKIAFANKKLGLVIDLAATIDDLEGILPSLDDPENLALVNDIGIALEVYHNIIIEGSCYFTIEC